MNKSVGRAWWVPYVFLSPFLAIFLTFVAYPLFESAILAGSQTFGPSHSVWVGTANFRHMFADPDFWTALENTALYTLASVAFQLPLALLLALVLNQPGLLGRSIFRLIFFLPSLVGTVFVAMMFGVILGEREGLVNTFLRAVVPGFPSEFSWLQNYVMSSLVIASIWMYVGFNMIYFLAALQSVSRDTLEAAAIDGANAWQKFLHVTLPEIRPVFAFVVLVSVIGSLQLFELPYVLLNGSGPERRGLTLVMYLYQNGFDRNDLGFASAIGWTMAIFLMGLALLQRRMTREA